MKWQREVKRLILFLNTAKFGGNVSQIYCRTLYLPKICSAVPMAVPQRVYLANKGFDTIDVIFGHLKTSNGFRSSRKTLSYRIL